MTQLLMPKATAVWLIDNTALTFEQIGTFCDLHPLEVQAIADGEVGAGIQGYDPVQNNQLTAEEIARCEADSSAQLTLSESHLPQPKLTDAQIGKLIGTTKETIRKIRERSHWNIQNIQAKHPAMLGLCSQNDLNAAIEKAGGDLNSPESQLQNISELP